MRKIVVLLVGAGILWTCSTNLSQESHEDYFAKVRPIIDGELAYETTAYVEQFWRLPGNPGFDSSIYFVVGKLLEMGFVEERTAAPADVLTYRLESRPLDRPAWEPVSGNVTFEDGESLLNFEDNRNMIAINSASTPRGGLLAEVFWARSLEDIVNSDVRGKIVYAPMSPWRFFGKAVVEGGAAGVMSYDMPDYLQPEKNQTSIQFRGIPGEADNAFGIVLSYDARTLLESRLEAGPVHVKVNLETRKVEAPELTLIAEVNGKSEERLVFSAHVQEPGANDNASGVGALTEIANALATLVREKGLRTERTITMLWGDEISSTRRYITEDSVRARTIKWGISLDMVGEDTEKTGGTFLIEKMPDPSAIWTRGNDKHSEWGGRKMNIEDMRPHYFNDFIINRFEEQGQFANWVVNTNPFEGGSDHVPFLRGEIPGLLLWHFTDQFYHTDNDRIDKVSRETLKNVATGALVSALELVNANEDTGLRILEILDEAAARRLDAEIALSKEVLDNNGDGEEQTLILHTWIDYYVSAIRTVGDVAPDSDVLQNSIEKSVSRFKEETLEKIESELDVKIYIQ